MAASTYTLYDFCATTVFFVVVEKKRIAIISTDQVHCTFTIMVVSIFEDGQFKVTFHQVIHFCYIYASEA